MRKRKKEIPKKEMSEGKTIALAVLLLTGGIVALVYGLKFLIGYFF